MKRADERQTAPIGPVRVVILPGEIDVTNIDAIEEDLIAAVSSGAALVIADLTGTTFIDTTGISALVLAHKQAAGRGAVLRIACGEKVHRVLGILGLDEFLAIFPDVTAARSAGGAAWLSDHPVPTGRRDGPSCRSGQRRDSGSCGDWRPGGQGDLEAGDLPARCPIPSPTAISRSGSPASAARRRPSMVLRAPPCLPGGAVADTDDVLELRPNCECCDRDLDPASPDVFICSFECTWCRDCAEDILRGVCPNCGGELVRRPIRPAGKLAANPPSAKRVFKPGCAPAVGR